MIAVPSVTSSRRRGQNLDSYAVRGKRKSRFPHRSVLLAISENERAEIVEDHGIELICVQRIKTGEPQPAKSAKSANNPPTRRRLIITPL